MKRILKKMQIDGNVNSIKSRTVTKSPDRLQFGRLGKSLKPVDSSKNPGLAKLPKEVRHKMGFAKKGGSTKRK